MNCIVTLRNILIQKLKSIYTFPLKSDTLLKLRYMFRHVQFFASRSDTLLNFCFEISHVINFLWKFGHFVIILIQIVKNLVNIPYKCWHIVIFWFKIRQISKHLIQNLTCCNILFENLPQCEYFYLKSDTF